MAYFAIRTKNRDELQKYLDNKGIGTVIQYPTAIHLQEAYDDLKFKKDAPFMLEWMHEQSINCNFKFDASSQTLETSEIYIETANQDKKISILQLLMIRMIIREQLVLKKLIKKI